MKRPECSLIGCGRIAILLEQDSLRRKPCTHFGGAASAGIRITSACDTDPGRLLHVQKAAGVNPASCFSCHRELLLSKRPHMVIIATWTDSHASIATEAIESGASIIILEKPVSYSLKEADKIIKAADRRGATVVVNHERRFDSRYRKVKSLIEKGEIGRVVNVNARIHTGRYRGKSSLTEGGGPLLHDGTHLVDIIRFLFGDIARARGKFHRIVPKPA